jgi:tetratricopeptide (TPR) repeat protein
MRARIPLVLVLAAGAAPAAPAQEHATHAPPAREAAPTSDSVPLFRAALGPYGRIVTTSSPDAQAYFNQGVQQMFAFTPTDARRSFVMARRRDPGCAMCAWGEAWSLGAYLNEPMRPANAAPAHAAVAAAQRLARGRSTPVEAALIDAMAARYQPAHDSSARRPLDSAYARAMERVYARFPADADVATLYAEALMLLEPRRGSWDIAKPSVRRIHEVLGGVLARDLAHPGACHLLIHATESTTRPELAEPCAEVLGLSIPGASHINHMPSHTFNRVGRWGDAVRANIRAWHSDQRAAYGEGFAIYPGHNLHMLLFSASMDGQGAVAMQAGRDYARLQAGGAFLPALAMVRFGRFAETLELSDAPGGAVTRGLWAFARGYAHLRLGHGDSAQAYAAVVDSIAAAAPAATFRVNTARLLLGTVGGILRGELHRAAGRLPDAIAALERAVTLEDSLVYDEPEPLPFAARHWLGAALLDAGRPVDAEAVYRAALADHPHNGWSLFGLAQALDAQGRRDEAAAARAAFDRSWARADVWLRASRF